MLKGEHGYGPAREMDRDDQIKIEARIPPLKMLLFVSNLLKQSVSAAEHAEV